MDFRVLIKILVTLALFVFIFYSIDINSTLKIIKNLSFYYFVMSLIVLVLQTFIASIRWQNVLKSLQMHIPYLTILKFQWIAIFFNQSLPSSIGGDAFRGYYLHREGFSVNKSALGVLLDRFLGVIGLTTIVIFTLPLLFNLINDSMARHGMILVAIGMLLLIFIILLLDFFSFLPPRWKIIRGMHSLSKEGRKIILSFSPGIFLVLISVVIHFLSVLSIVILSYGIQLNLEWSKVLLIVPLVTLVMIVPISIAGWGVREGAMVVGLGYMGVLQEEALALSLLYGVSLLMLSFPGLVMWFLKYRSVDDKTEDNKLQ